ncbi:P-selectin-like [Physella acuta]|uniref:P-selectin-like n=1 Tax=Physella acuta TaxID=109671 RepID=UPI0027DE8729|nr:P-selectin-like [Physella acuta]
MCDSLTKHVKLLNLMLVTLDVASGVKCSTPPNVDNSRWDGCEMSYKSNCTLLCHKGYHVEGIKTITCQANRQWTTPGNCVVNLCQTLGTANGLWQYSSSTTGKLKCRSGYKVEGNKAIDCQENGQWTIPGRCVELDCKTPQTVVNGEWRFCNQRTCHLNCKKGFKLEGREIINCQDDETWSSPGQCEELGCKTPPTVVNGVWALCNQSTCHLNCRRGYKLKGSEIIKCQDNETWTLPGRCIETKCKTPQTLENGKWRFCNGTTCHLKCRRGYKVEGNAIIKCQDNEEWSLPGRCIDAMAENGCIEGWFGPNCYYNIDTGSIRIPDVDRGRGDPQSVIAVGMSVEGNGP